MERIKKMEEALKFKQEETEIMLERQKKEYKERVKELEQELEEVFRLIFLNSFLGKRKTKVGG